MTCWRPSHGSSFNPILYKAVVTRVTSHYEENQWALSWPNWWHWLQKHLNSAAVLGRSGEVEGITINWSQKSQTELIVIESGAHSNPNLCCLDNDTVVPESDSEPTQSSGYAVPSTRSCVAYVKPRVAITTPRTLAGTRSSWKWSKSSWAKLVLVVLAVWMPNTSPCLEVQNLRSVRLVCAHSSCQLSLIPHYYTSGQLWFDVLACV